MFYVSLICAVGIGLGADGALVHLVPMLFSVVGSLLNLAHETSFTYRTEKEKPVLRCRELVSERKRK